MGNISFETGSNLSHGRVAYSNDEMPHIFAELLTTQSFGCIRNIKLLALMEIRPIYIPSKESQRHE